MFIAGAVVVGGVAIVGAYDDHSRYSEYTKHSRYGDESVRQNISSYERRVENKEDEVQRLYDKYQRLPYYDLDQAKNDMRRELENEISRDKQELAEVDKMISKINELELQSRR